MELDQSVLSGMNSNELMNKLKDFASNRATTYDRARFERSRNQIIVLQKKMNILVSILKILFPMLKKILSNGKSQMIEIKGEIGNDFRTFFRWS
ncbi:MAG: hypothetical protein HS129_00585 [Leptospiraceae bacterium]|nr:hypothetical protein [Leptospiraceae bacterium]